jgi:NitT/TauT family transport system substrate-binding protein
MFPNVTHAPALVALHTGRIAARQRDGGLPPPRTAIFGSGTEAVEALFAGAIDVAHLGANPAINAHVRSGGRAIRVIAGSTVGGAALVVQPEVRGARDLRGRLVATPGLGTSQDVALRTWLAAEGMPVTIDGAGEVVIAPQGNAAAYASFGTRTIAGAWVPEPWVTRLERDAGGVVLVDERDRWPSTGGRFVTTQLVVRTAVLERHRVAVRALLAAHLDALEMLAGDRRASIRATGAAIEAITGRPIPSDTLDASFVRLGFGHEPEPAALAIAARNAAAVGLVDPVDLDRVGLGDLVDRSLLAELVVGGAAHAAVPTLVAELDPVLGPSGFEAEAGFEEEG